jgi:tellurite resistance protein TehA-like permease
VRSSRSAALARIVDTVPPADGAAVMATGIVSVGLSLDGHETLSRILLGVDVALWLGLCAIFLARLLWQRPRWHEESRLPAGLTAVAATAVLGTRLSLLGADVLPYVLLVLALCLWLVLLPPVLGHWQTPTLGASFVLAVSTESLAVLAGQLALSEGVDSLAAAALVPLVLGLVAYGFVLARFDFRQVVAGRGDHWVAGGALAIAALACAHIAQAASGSAWLDALRPTLEDASLALWAAAACWLPVLIACELVSPRLSYDPRRWSTAFPVAMYAACSFAVGDAAGADGLVTFARVWIWVAVAVWVVVGAGMLRRGLALVRAPAPRAQLSRGRP